MTTCGARGNVEGTGMVELRPDSSGEPRAFPMAIGTLSRMS